MKANKSPWIVKETANAMKISCSTGPICRVKKTNLANARLIAASPDLLSTLIEIKSEIESTPEVLDSALLGLILLKVQNAVSKATDLNF